MKTLKYSIITLALLGLSASVFASPVTATKSYVNGVFLGGDWLRLQSLNGDTDYVNSFPIDVLGPPVVISNISPNYRNGFYIFGGVRFGGVEDVAVGWTEFRSANSNALVGFPVSTLGNPLVVTPRWLFPSQWGNVNGAVSYDLDEGYAELGHTVHFTSPWTLRLAGGVDYAKINSKMSVTANLDGAGNTLFGFINTSDTKGWGPRVAAAVIYHMPYGFALFADANMALLVTDRKINLQSINIADGLSPSATFNTRDVIIPKFGTKLGLSYTYLFCQNGGINVGGTNTKLKLEAGWQADVYLDAIEREQSSFIAEFNSQTVTSNYGVQGVFLGATLDYDWL